LSGGGVVARGKIRVDARRAVAKLREHLLVDLHMYTLELARSAVALGATRVDLAWDTDDVFIAWDGAPVGAGALTRLLDHVLADGGPEERPFELLGLAINAALGLRPKYIDVYSGAADGVMRARWQPELLDRATAELPRATAAEPPPILRYPGTCVHVRKRVGATALKRALVGDLPAEVALLSEATLDFVPALRLLGKLRRRPSPRPLLRVALDVPGAQRAWLEVREPSSGPATLELLERGVCMERLRWSPGWFPDQPYGGVGLPLRVVIDAHELETNASRSAVREGAAIVASAVERSAAAMRDAVAALIALRRGGTLGDLDPSRIEVLDRHEDRLEDALGALACVVVGASRRPAATPPPPSDEAAALLELPLLRDGVGQPRSLSSVVAGSQKLPLYVWRGSAPLPQELAPWMRDVIWARGRVVENTFSELYVVDAAEVVRLARIGAERRGKHLSHPPAQPGVARSPEHVARESFRQDRGGFAGIRGEVAVVAVPGRPLRAGATVRVFIEDRPFEAIELALEVSRLPFEAALAWDGRLVPRFAYDGVERDGSLQQALWFATRAALLAVDRIAHRFATAQEPERSMLAALLRAALVTHVQAASALGLEKSVGDVPVTALRGIYDARVWPTVDPSRLVSLRQLADHAQRTGALCTAPEGTIGCALDDRPVVAVDAAEQAALAAALGGSVTQVPYARALVDAGGDRVAAESTRLQRLHHELTQLGVGATPRLVIRSPRALTVVAPDETPRLVWVHAGTTICQQKLAPALGPVSMAIDDDRLVPTPEWNAVAWSDRGRISHAQRDLCAALATALGGPHDVAASAGGEGTVQRADNPARLGYPGPALRVDLVGDLPSRPWDVGASVRAYLVRCAAELRSRVARGAVPSPTGAGSAALESGAQLLDRLERLPIVAWLDADGEPTPASLRAAGAWHPSSVPIVTTRPGFETAGWQPLFVETPAERQALERWFGSRAQLADAELTERARGAKQVAARRRMMALPEVDPSGVADAADPSRAFRADGIFPSGVVSLTVALPRLDASRTPVTCATVEILCERRLVATQVLSDLPLPVIARVGVADSMLEGWSMLSLVGAVAVANVVRVAAWQLVSQVVRSACGQGNSAALFGDLRVLELCVALCRGGSSPDLVASLRSDKLLWPTVQCSEEPLVTLRASGSVLWIGRRRYEGWRRPSRAPADLDHPVAYIPRSPSGRAVEALLEAMSMTTLDVTDELDRLQDRRAAATPAAVPALAGAASHPMLRASLAELGVKSAAGELELIATDASEVQVTLETGARVPMDGAREAGPPPVPHRAVALIEGEAASPALLAAVARDIADAAERRLVQLAPAVDQLPAFVRERMRALLCRRLAGAASPELEALAAAPLLPDVAGGWHALAAVRAVPEWPATLLEPPYPRRSYGRPVLRLTAAELIALAGPAQLADVTETMRADLGGEQRASAAPLAKVELLPDVRGRCAYAFQLLEDGVTGEVGVLLPTETGARGISVHVGRRPLCLMPDGPGWPVRAAVEAPDATPTRGFDGLASPDEADALHASVRRAVERGVRRAIAVPADALAVRWLGMQGVEPDPTLAVLGAVWLPARWPRDPQVAVCSPADGGARRSLPMVLRTQLALMSGLVPVEGELLVRAATGVEPLEDRAWGRLAALCFQAVASMVAEVAGGGTAGEVLEPYRWNLRLLGNPSGGDPVAPLAGGGTVSSGRVLDELYRRRSLWFSAGRGTAEGEFPAGEAPAFVLADGSPLLEVLRHRADAGVLRELGGEAGAAVEAGEPPPSQPDVDVVEVDFEDERQSAASSQTVLVEGGLFDPGPARPTALDSASSWLHGIKRRVLALVPRRKVSEEAPPSRRGLRLALREAVQRLGLTGNPVIAVVYAKRGRPVGYLKRKRTLVINREHPAVRAAQPGSPGWPLLVAAAVCEVNRALAEVTDAEEHRALYELLRAPDERPGG
jgi:hypothetical protein